MLFFCEHCVCVVCSTIIASVFFRLTLRSLLGLSLVGWLQVFVFLRGRAPEKNNVQCVCAIAPEKYQ